MLDNRTLLLVGFLIPLSFMIIQLLEFGWTNKQAVKENIGANFLYFLGSLLYLFRDSVPIFFSCTLSNTLIFLGGILILSTTFILFEVSVSFKRTIFFGSVAFLLLLFFTFVKNSMLIRYFIVSVGIGFLYLYGVVNLLVKTRHISKKLLLVFVIEFLILSIGSILRFLFFRSSFDLLENNISSSLYIILTSLFIIIWNYTIQLKRNSMFLLQIEYQTEKNYKIQEDVSILNHVYFEKSINCSLDKLYKNIFELINKRFSINKIALYVFNEDKLTPAFSKGFSNKEVDIILGKQCEITLKSIEDIEVMDIYMGDLDNTGFKELLIKNELIGGVVFPLFTSGNRIGSIFVGITPSSTIVNMDRDIFYSICRQVAGVIYSANTHNKLIETQMKLKEMASIDHLTGIYNRREFFVQFRGEFNSALRHKDFLTLFMVDLDDFKFVNDSYGHDAGDLVLIEVVKYIRSQLRINDLFARYGGEEFVGVLLRSDPAGASEKIRKIIKNVSNLRILTYPDIRIKISVGACHYHEEFESIETMIKKADIALYKAKKSGKNQLCEG